MVRCLYGNSIDSYYYAWDSYWKCVKLYASAENEEEPFTNIHCWLRWIIGILRSHLLSTSPIKYQQIFNTVNSIRWKYFKFFLRLRNFHQTTSDNNIYLTFLGVLFPRKNTSRIVMIIFNQYVAGRCINSN